MILYHGSNLEIKSPSLRYSRSSLDFGAGFYTTTDFDQAKRWAGRVVRLRRAGVPTISVFETDSDQWDHLSVLRFDAADAAWLDLVVKYRTGQDILGEYDVITGPVANDRTVDVINQYIAGFYPVDVALRLLLPMKLKDQWTLKTEAAISSIHWKETILL